MSGKWGLSIAQAVKIIGRSEATVRRWWDEDMALAEATGSDAPGKWIRPGRTGRGERRCDPMWAARRRRQVEVEDAEAAAPPVPANGREDHTV